VATDGDSYRMKQPEPEEEPRSTTVSDKNEEWELYLATTGDPELAVNSI
jgi:hypothetical protein